MTDSHEETVRDYGLTRNFSSDNFGKSWELGRYYFKKKNMYIPSKQYYGHRALGQEKRFSWITQTTKDVICNADLIETLEDS